MQFCKWYLLYRGSDFYFPENVSSPYSRWQRLWLCRCGYQKHKTWREPFVAGINRCKVIKSIPFSCHRPGQRVLNKDILQFFHGNGYILKIDFIAKLGKGVRLRVYDMKADANGAEVSTLMYSIITKNIFCSSGGASTSKLWARAIGNGANHKSNRWL